MILPTKKDVLSEFITLFFCFTIYTISQSIGLGDWSFPNTPDDPTHTHETFVTHHENYDTYTESYINNETKDYIFYENIIYHDELKGPDLNNSNNYDSTTSSHDHLTEFALESRRQEIAENESTLINKKNTRYAGKKEVIFECNLGKKTILRPWQMENSVFDSTLILEKVHTIDDFIKAIQSPIVQARFKRVQYPIKIDSKKWTYWKEKAALKKSLAFIDMTLSGKINELLHDISNGDIASAEKAFAKLKQLWPYDRNYTFLLSTVNYTELQFINEYLGVNIMKIAERNLITRQDYITKHTNAQEQKTIHEYREKCYLLQQKGNAADLFDQRQQLYHCINANGNKHDLLTHICFAIVENCYLNPITSLFRSIIREPSLEKACDHLKNLEKQIIIQAEQHGIIPMKEIRTWVINHYGFDVLDAAQNCYKSRSDYVYTPNNQSYLSDTIKSILNNMESKVLPRAHAELVNLEKQIDKTLEERNITDPIAQKEYIKKLLGRDVLGIAHKTYEARSDHKKLVESFISIDIDQITTSILGNNTTYDAVATEMNDLAKQVFINARHCKISNLPKIESHVYDSIDAMRTAQDHPTFIFNFSMVHHTLGDIQQIAHAILSGKHPVLERSSELLIRGFETFFKGLDPFTQASSIGHLASDLGSLLKKGGIALWNDPITVIHNGVTSVFTLTEFIRNTADFTSDLTVGKLYLSPEEYKKRTDAFCAMIKPLKGVTAEQCIDFVAQVAADALFFKGLGNAYNFLKEIDVLGKLSESAAFASRAFKKGIDTHLASNPIMVTAEGIPICHFAPEIVECMERAGQETNSKKIIEIAVKQLPKNQDRLLNVITEFESIKLQYAGAIFSLDKKGLKHILSRHHPKYWDGSLKAGQSFFGKHTKVNDIVEVITKVIEQNRELIIMLKDNKQFQIRGTVNGIQYVLGTKNGRIAQLYPILK